MVAELSNPELKAGLVLAQAQLGQARAARDRVYAGPRQEQVDALARDIDMANANLVYARQQFNRSSQLTAAGFASHQDLDKATAAAVETANANLSRAKELHEADRLGPTREERAVADAAVEAAAAAVAVVAARVAKLRITAPSDGTVALLVAEPGEAIVPGQPLMTLQKVGERWASFNLREDQLDELRIGSRVELMPASGTVPIYVQIDEIVPRGEFATWRAARAVGDHDLNTFVLRGPGRSGFRGAAARDVGLAETRQPDRAVTAAVPNLATRFVANAIYDVQVNLLARRGSRAMRLRPIGCKLYRIRAASANHRKRR